MGDGKRIAAFFDMDRTLLHCNSGSEWVRFLRKRREISAWRMLRASLWLAQYKLSILDMETVTRKVTASMAGELEQDTIDKCVVFNAEVVFPQVADKARAALAQHRADGHVLAILSSSTPYLTEPLARHLGIEHVICTRLEVDGGKFVGRHRAPACYGAGKVHWAERFAESEGVDLARSFFYTDSFTDLPMLERVGEARVINPDGRLLRHARKVGWPIDVW